MKQNFFKTMTKTTKASQVRSVRATSSFLLFLLLFAFTGPTWACLKMAQVENTESQTSKASCHSAGTKKTEESSSNKDCPFCSSSSCFTNAVPTSSNISFDEAQSKKALKLATHFKGSIALEFRHPDFIKAKSLNLKRPPSNWQATFSIFII